MNREEKAALKIHNTALKEGENYAKTHGHSIIEEVAYGRGFKSGYMRGAVETEEELIEKAAEWIKKNCEEHIWWFDNECGLEEEFYDKFKMAMKNLL